MEGERWQHSVQFVSMNLPCATSHSNASKLDAVFVVQCFIQCLLVRKEKRRKEKRREEKRQRRKKKGREKKRRRGERGSTVLMSSTLPCVVSKTPPCAPARRPHVFNMRASCRYTRRRFETTHGSVQDMSTAGGGGGFRAPSRATYHTTTPHNTTTHHQHNMYTQRHMYTHTLTTRSTTDRDPESFNVNAWI